MNQVVEGVWGRLLPLTNGHRVTLLDGSLFLQFVGVQDSGRYVCVVNNSEGENRAFTVLSVSVNDGQLLTRPNYHGLGNAVATIIREEGIRGLYRGVTPNCWGAGASWGFYFLFYNAIKVYMSEGGNKKTLGAGSHMLAAAEADL